MLIICLIKCNNYSSWGSSRPISVPHVSHNSQNVFFFSPNCLQHFFSPTSTEFFTFMELLYTLAKPWLFMSTQRCKERTPPLPPTPTMAAAQVRFFRYTKTTAVTWLFQSFSFNVWRVIFNHDSSLHFHYGVIIPRCMQLQSHGHQLFCTVGILAVKEL